VREDVNGKLWVLCTGDYQNTYNGMLYRIDPVSKSVEQSLSFPAGAFPADLCMNSQRDQLFFISTHVFKMGINDSSLPSTPFIASNGNTYYSLAVDPQSNEIYVADAIDYIQRGRIYRYYSSGTLHESVLAGILPGSFLFF
jgi:hypothetical protein